MRGFSQKARARVRALARAAHPLGGREVGLHFRNRIIRTSSRGSRQRRHGTANGGKCLTPGDRPGGGRGGRAARHPSTRQLQGRGSAKNQRKGSNKLHFDLNLVGARDGQFYCRQ